MVQIDSITMASRDFNGVEGGANKLDDFLFVREVFEWYSLC